MERFRNSILCFVFAFMLSNNILSQTIRFENTDYPHSKLIFASHFGEKVYKIYEFTTDINGFTLIYNDSLPTGLYYLILQDSSNLEIFYDQNFSGKIEVYYKKLSNQYDINGPLPTVLYNEFSNSFFSPELQLALDPNKLIDDVIKKDQNSFLTNYLLAQKNIKVPPYTPPSNVANKDSAIWKYRTEFYQNHYLDNINLSDSRFISTPIYTEKVNEYLHRISKQKPEEILNTINMLIEKASESIPAQKFMTEYLLSKFSKDRMKPASEYVYVNMIREHYLNSGYTWITDSTIKHLNSDYNRLFPSSLGQTAPYIEGHSPKGKDVRLFDSEHKLIVLYFYDYDCPICGQLIPRLNWITSVYDYMDIEIFAVCMGDNETKWKKYINKHGISRWTHLYNYRDQGNVAYNYNLSFTPTLFLLDGDRKIIGKNLNTKLLEDLILEKALNRNKKP